jgi:hypothetical protein
VNRICELGNSIFISFSEILFHFCSSSQKQHPAQTSIFFFSSRGIVHGFQCIASGWRKTFLRVEGICIQAYVISFVPKGDSRTVQRERHAPCGIFHASCGTCHAFCGTSYRRSGTYRTVLWTSAGETGMSRGKSAASDFSYGTLRMLCGTSNIPQGTSMKCEGMSLNRWRTFRAICGTCSLPKMLCFGSFIWCKGTTRQCCTVAVWFALYSSPLCLKPYRQPVIAAPSVSTEFYAQTTDAKLQTPFEDVKPKMRKVADYKVYAGNEGNKDCGRWLCASRIWRKRYIIVACLISCCVGDVARRI